MTWTDAERTFLGASPLGRLATASADGEPDVAAVGFALDGDDVVIGGMDLPRTLKHRNVLANGRASFVVDELVSRTPWRPRGLKLTGVARVETGPDGRPVIRLTAETIWSWGLNDGAEKHFGPIEKRRVSR